MRFRTYKNTDLEVSEVGFGLWTVSTGWWGNFTEGEAIALMHNAFDERRAKERVFVGTHAGSENVQHPTLIEGGRSDRTLNARLNRAEASRTGSLKFLL